ncbi:hypothetical protein Lal_00025119 [Lupinus albus]|nr:hypothetical protein Lal_00025119 [Lupinus albus]
MNPKIEPQTRNGDSFLGEKRGRDDFLGKSSCRGKKKLEKRKDSKVGGGEGETSKFGLDPRGEIENRTNRSLKNKSNTIQKQSIFEVSVYFGSDLSGFEHPYLKIMSSITSSSTRLLTFGIFISRVIEYVRIDTCNEEVIVVNPIEHLIDVSLIHNMSIYKYGGVWMYQEDYQTIVEISDEDENANLVE